MNSGENSMDELSDPAPPTLIVVPTFAMTASLVCELGQKCGVAPAGMCNEDAVALQRHFAADERHRPRDLTWA